MAVQGRAQSSSAAPRLHSSPAPRLGASEPPIVRWALIGAAVAVVGLLLVLPLVLVFGQALEKGLTAYWAALQQPDTLAALRLTLLVAAIAVPLNVLFGLAAAWLIARFDFIGKSMFITLIDLPFSVSPVTAGM